MNYEVKQSNGTCEGCIFFDEVGICEEPEELVKEFGSCVINNHIYVEKRDESKN